MHVFGLPEEWHNYVLNIIKGISHETHERKPSTPEGSKMKNEMGARLDNSWSFCFTLEEGVPVQYALNFSLQSPHYCRIWWGVRVERRCILVLLCSIWLGRHSWLLYWLRRCIMYYVPGRIILNKLSTCLSPNLFRRNLEDGPTSYFPLNIYVFMFYL